MPRTRFLSCGFLLLAVVAADVAADEVSWQRIQLDDTFRSEGVAAADFNHDGLKDVVAGDVWYAAPDWTMHELRPVGEYDGTKGYSNSFCNFTHDVNGDGWDDVIVVGFPGEPFHWYENPQNEPGHWKEHEIWHSACNETPEFEDVTGDGKPEVVLGSQPESQMGFLSIPEGDAVYEKWTFHAISRPGDPMKNGTFKYYHGLGIGDLDGDGRADVLIPNGCWKAPDEATNTPWEFHEFALSRDDGGEALKAANLHVEDLDLDGDNDVMMSSAHAYGVWWFENQSEEEVGKFTYHLIDESYSQTHALEFIDIDGDGQRDLVTGKRFYAHQGHDPGGKEPVGMYWYQIKRSKNSPPQFVKHEIVEGRDTGLGTQFLVADMNKDELPDIVLSNKKGVNVLLQTRGGSE